MRFELPATRTLEFTGNRTVPILSCGGDKQSFTVVLAVKADGEKLPPKVIFKGVRQLRIEVPRRKQVSVHKKAWMDEEGLFFFLYRYFVGARLGIFVRLFLTSITSSTCFLARSLFTEITLALFTNLFAVAALIEVVFLSICSLLKLL